MKQFSTRLKELRVRNDLQQKDIADETAFTISQISDWERQKSRPNLDQLVTLAEYFGVSADYLLGIEPETAIEPQLPADEREVLEMYRRLSPKDKERIRTALEIFGETETAQQQKKGG